MDDVTAEKVRNQILKARERSKRFYRKHHQQVLERNRAYYHSHREEILAKLQEERNIAQLVKLEMQCNGTYPAASERERVDDK